MDTTIAIHANHLLQVHDGLEDSILRFEQLSKIFFVVVLVATFVLARGAAAQSLRRGVTGALASAALAVAVAAVIAAVVDRARPFVADPTAIHLFAPHPADSGFPSDHATAAFAIATAMLLRDRAVGLTLIAVAALVSVGRVAIGVHYPTDVLAGALLGALAAAVCFTPWIRALTDGVADRFGVIVDRLLAQVSRRPAADSAHG